MSTALTQAASLRDMLQRCAAAMVHYLDAALARIWTLTPEENVLKLQASAGLYTHLDGPHSRVPVGQFKIGLMAQERKQAERENRRLGRYNRLLLESIGEGIYSLDT